MVDFSSKKVELEKKAARVDALEQQLRTTSQKLMEAEMCAEELRLDAEDMRQAFQVQLNVLATENERLKAK